MQNGSNSASTKVGGSCACSKLRYNVDIDNADKAKTSVCHCRPCRKISGGTASLNLTVPASTFVLESGQLRNVKLKHIDEGFDYSLFFCENCGSPIYAAPHFLDNKIVIQVGTIDDIEMLQRAPAVELNVGHRLGWVCRVQDAEQRERY